MLLEIKKELDFYDFIDLYGDLMEDYTKRDKELIYNYFLDFSFGTGESLSDTDIRDIIRFEIKVATFNDFLNDYGYLYKDIPGYYKDDKQEDETKEAFKIRLILELYSVYIEIDPDVESVIYITF